MTASMWPQVATALRTVFDAQTDVDVYDGIPTTYEQLAAGVAVGVDAAFDDGTSGDIRQEWREAGPAPDAHREEWGEVVCTVWAQSGDDDLAAVRVQVFDILDDCLDSLHTITALGIPEVLSVRGLSSAKPVQRRTSRGVVCEVAFRVAYYAVFN
jgi:hypothetical protein